MATSTVNFCRITYPSAALPLNRAMQLTVSKSTQSKSLCHLIHKNLKVEGHRGVSFCMSIDVGKEDNSSVDVKPNGPVEADGEMYSAEAAVANPRSELEEKFAVLNTGKYECSSCGYVYDQALGDQVYPIAPGLEFSKLPEDWRCPTCGAAQSYFNSKSIEVAGFAQNQQFGLGGNSLTGGQKSALIFGSLLFLFILFLSGYFLQ
ncbi:hypothetical protein SUGI_0615930 [Cryptomeria japonica]|nr:hypothetical protein SUGI_0615930 [Cryptomeria japonica]